MARLIPRSVEVLPRADPGSGPRSASLGAAALVAAVMWWRPCLVGWLNRRDVSATKQADSVRVTGAAPVLAAGYEICTLDAGPSAPRSKEQECQRRT
jgi:hypothetical protein